MRVAFLTQRLPYAPNRGDRVRAFHEVRALAAAGHEVHLVSLVHSEEEAAHAGDLLDIVASVRTAAVPRRRNLLRGVPVLCTRRPLTHTLLNSPEIGPALESLVLRCRPQVAVAYCSSMARFTVQSPLSGVPYLLDMVDVDSAKWAALSDARRYPMAWVYRREARLLGGFEGEAARKAVATYVVNQREADALRPLAGVSASIEVMQNGVDVEPLRPRTPPRASNHVVFCGVMNYGPNEEGAIWLAEAVWPGVRKERPDARLLLVGAEPTARVRALGNRDRSIVVTGSVADVRPYLWDSAVAAAPLHIARGVQNKVLEAVGAGLPAVVTPVVAAGLPAEVMPACTVADSAPEFAAALLNILRRSPEERRALAEAAPLRMIGWERRLRPLLTAVAALEKPDHQ